MSTHVKELWDKDHYVLYQTNVDVGSFSVRTIVMNISKDFNKKLNIIGVENAIRLYSETKYFRRETLHHDAYVGRRSFEESACWYVDRAQFGIIMIDESDKLRKTPGMTGKDIGGESVQQQLLALMEGSTVNVELKGHGITAQKVQFDTSNVLFILCGAFAGIEEIVRKRTCNHRHTMGFGGDIERPDPVSASDLIMQVTPKDLTDFGMIPELIGRVPVKAKLRTLTEDELVKILTEPKDSVIKGYKAEFMMDGVSLYFEEDALNEIAKISIDQGTGARGIRTIVDNLMLDIVFNLPFGSNVKTLKITKKMLEKSLENL